MSGLGFMRLTSYDETIKVNLFESLIVMQQIYFTVIFKIKMNIAIVQFLCSVLDVLLNANIFNL